MNTTPARQTFARCRDICAAFNIDFADMRNQYRVLKHQTEPYRLIISYLRFDKGWTQEQIAKYLRKERSTIAHALRGMK